MEINKIGPINPAGNNLKGIIYELSNTHGITNPIEKNIIVPSSSTTTSGNINSTVLWNTDFWRTLLAGNSNVYLQFKFPGRYLYPTGYSFRGVAPSGSYWYQTSWIVYGFNEGEENDVNKWDILAINTSYEQNFCGGAENCNGKVVATYSIKPTNKGYRYIRWKDLDSSIWNNQIITASAVEIFGTLTTSAKLFKLKSVCTCKLLASRMKIIDTANLILLAS